MGQLERLSQVVPGGTGRAGGGGELQSSGVQRMLAGPGHLLSNVGIVKYTYRPLH